MECMSTMLAKVEHPERQKNSSCRVKCQSGFTTLPPKLLQDQPVVVLC
jgi:hypothetical protein